MVRINENIVFDFQTGSFIQEPFENYRSTVTSRRLLFVILFPFQALVGMFITGALTDSRKSVSLSTVLTSVIVTLILSCLIILILKMTGLIKNFHLGYIIPKRGLRDRLEEMDSEDKFIYTTVSRKEIKSHQESLKIENVAGSPIKLLHEIKNKKQLILKYSVAYQILYFVVALLFWLVFKYGLSDASYAVWGTAFLISGYGYLFMIYVVGLSPIKSYHTWNILEKALEKYIKENNIVDQRPIIDYEKIHKEVEKE